MIYLGLAGIKSLSVTMTALKPAGNFVIGRRETVGARLLGIELLEQPVAFFGEKANLLAQVRERNAVFGFGKGLPQEGLELLDSHVEPLSSPLQGVGLAHRCTLPAEAPRFLSETLRLLDLRLDVNVGGAQN